MQNPKKLLVTARARELAVLTYRATQALPRDERFGLTSQMRRAAVSIGSNIAEGCGRQSDTAFAAFLHYALGSANELEFQLGISLDLAFLPVAECEILASRIIEMKKMLSRLIVSVSRKG